MHGLSSAPAFRFYRHASGMPGRLAGRCLLKVWRAHTRPLLLIHFFKQRRHMSAMATATVAPLPPRSGGEGAGVGGASANSLPEEQGDRPPDPPPPRATAA